VQVRECQPSHLGQALVRFKNAHRRDFLVTQSPFQFSDVQVSIVSTMKAETGGLYSSIGSAG
jgi:hypothetical protein